MGVAWPLELRLHAHPHCTPWRWHKTLRQRVQVVAVGDVLQRYIQARVLLQLIVEEQTHQCHFAVVQLRRGGAGLPRFVGGDGGAAGVGNTCAEREALVKEAQAGGQVARKPGRVLGVGVGTHEASRRAARGVGGFLVAVAGGAQCGGESRVTLLLPLTYVFIPTDSTTYSQAHELSILKVTSNTKKSSDLFNHLHAFMFAPI